jgi:predicted MFS family arabinose efflux permease
MLYPLTQIVVLFLAIRLLHGIAWGWSTTVNGTAAVDVVPNSRLGEGMGYFGLSTTIGMIIAPSLGIYLYQVTEFKYLIYISGLLGVIAVILFAAVIYHTPDAVKNANKKELTFSYLDSLIEKSCFIPSLIMLFVTFGYGTIVTFIVIFGEERGIDKIFLFYLCNAIMATIVRPISGKWFDQKGPIGLVLLCVSFTFLGIWVLSFAHSNSMIAISGILFGMGFGSLIPTLQSWALSMTPPSRRGVANGMIFSSLDLGIGVSGLVFGFLAEFFELALLFQISSLFLIAALVLTFVEKKRSKEKRQQLPVA